ncbi:MAG: aminotransferase class V-fold PLP-dependent enzyme [Dehalococcoidia bacterium]
MSLRKHWQLDPNVAFLNHGSYGACPHAVLARQSALRERMERQPVQFLGRDLEALLDEARQALAAFVGADPAGLAFVPNATTGVNAFLSSFPLAPGDQVLLTDHAYNACRNALEAVAARAGAEVVVAPVPFPLPGDEEVVGAILAAATPRTRLALIDHVTSPTALVFPIARIVRELATHDVETIVDGAHAPGMLDVDVAAIGAAGYAGNCHKWLCSPKGAGFLYVREDFRDRVRPTVISHGANRRGDDRSRFHAEFDWTGTGDPTAYLSVPEAIRYVGSLLPGGWDEIRASNHDKVVAARRMLLGRLGVEAPCPEEMLGSMAAIPLSADGVGRLWTGFERDDLQAALLDEHGIEVPVLWFARRRRILRISAQVYNEPEEYERLAGAVVKLLGGSP